MRNPCQKDLSSYFNGLFWLFGVVCIGIREEHVGRGNFCRNQDPQLSLVWRGNRVILFAMIDKIGYTRPPLAARIEAKRRASENGGVSFSDMLDEAEAAGDVENTAGVASPVSVGLLGLQEISEEEIQRQRALKKGRATLDALEQLRDQLLVGSVPMATLHKLERLVAEERAAGADPRLSAILDEIEVRAAVELAKLERAQQR
jgi:hypothetical protein